MGYYFIQTATTTTTNRIKHKRERPPRGITTTTPTIVHCWLQQHSKLLNLFPPLPIDEFPMIPRDALWCFGKSEARRDGLSGARSPTHTHTHAFCYTPTAGVGREREEFGRKKKCLCMQIKPRRRKRRAVWMMKLVGGKKKELSSADLFRFKFPPNTYTHRCCPARERARDGLLITIDFFFSFSSSLFSIFRRIYPSTCWPPPLYIYIYTYVYKYITHI